MKRFLLKSKRWGTVVLTVDDEDAYLLRTMVWNVSGTKIPQVAKRIDGKMTPLSHAIMDPKRGQWVRHANGCSLDFRRANLVVTAARKQAA